MEQKNGFTEPFEQIVWTQFSSQPTKFLYRVACVVVDRARVTIKPALIRCMSTTTCATLYRKRVIGTGWTCSFRRVQFESLGRCRQHGCRTILPSRQLDQRQHLHHGSFSNKCHEASHSFRGRSVSFAPRFLIDRIIHFDKVTQQL